MAASYIDLKIAERKLRVRNSTTFVSFVTTLWRGEVLMCSYSHISNGIIGIFSKTLLDVEEADQLETLIKNYFYEGKGEIK